MEFLGPAIIAVGVCVVIGAIILWSKKKDKRTSRQKHLDEISEMRGDNKKAGAKR